MPDGTKYLDSEPAAFGRLCVETSLKRKIASIRNPAAFGRLCVETRCDKPYFWRRDPAAFGRLCVETLS